jgi:hypothetical protein
MGRFVRAVALAALVGVLATGCERDVTKEVLFVNDSVTHLSLVALVAELNTVKEGDVPGRYAPNFGSSMPGIGLRQVWEHSSQSEIDEYWFEHMVSLVEHVKPEVIVVELGYNDCGYDLSNYGAHIDNLLSAVPAETPVHWLTMGDPNNNRTCDDTVNAAITAAVTRWPNLSIFDFGAFMHGHTEWADDGVHLNPDGQNAYADWLHGQLDAVYGPGATTTSTSTTTTSTTTTSSTTTTTTTLPEEP